MALIFATRPSALARWQTQWVMAELQRLWPGLECREEVITTQGDRILDKPLPEIGGKGLFTQELEAEILAGRVHAAVHSLKDLPVESVPALPVAGVPALPVAAVPARADVRDVLISAAGYRLDDLPRGARVGTSSLRRAAQLLALRPDLQIEPLRGNIDTRLHKARQGQYAAIVLAGAGIQRLGLESAVTEWLPLERMLPAPGQGALAVQCRAADAETRRCLSALEDPAARRAVTAERTFLASLGGGCSLPVAAYAIAAGEGERPEIRLEGMVASPDGQRLIRLREQGEDPRALGLALARQALEQGAAELLALS
jgi:hydroxymethylbilane synthase